MFTVKYTGIALISIPYRGKLCLEKLANFFSASKIIRQILGNSESPKLKEKLQVIAYVIEDYWVLK